MSQLQMPGVDWLDYDQSITLQVYRYGVQETFECDTIQDAVRLASGLEGEGYAVPYALLNAREEVIMDHDQLRSRVDLHERTTS